MRPQYSGSGNVTRLNALGVGIVPCNVTTPVIVPPLSTSTTSYASAPGLMMENHSTVAILIANCQKDVLIGIPLDNVFYINRVFKKAFQRGHSEGRGEAYPRGTLSPLSGARTKLVAFFNILLRCLLFQCG